MCIGATKAQSLPPTPPQAPTMADPAVQQARMDEQKRAAKGGLADTSLTTGLGGTGGGARTLAGAN